MKKPLILIISLLFTFTILLSGCSKSAYVAKVNGEEISKQDYESRINDYKSYLETKGVDLTSDEGKTTLKNSEEQVLTILISQKILKQAVIKNKWDINSADITEQLNSIKTQLGDDEQQYKTWLTQQILVEEDVKYNLCFRQNIGNDVTISDDEILKYYEANPDLYSSEPEQVKAKHILVKTKEEALEIIKELNAGKDFAELAKEKSIEPAAKTSGGELGYFNKGDMVAEFEAAAFSQKIGEISAQPIETQFGYHVILVEDHKQAIENTFESVKDKVKADAIEKLKSDKAESEFTKLHEEAKIEYAEGYAPQESN